MKKFLSFLLAASCMQQASAQAPSIPSRWSVDLTAGPAGPLGKFAGIHNENTSHGVSTGGSIELAGEYSMCHHFSAILTFSGQRNPGNGVPQALSSSYVDATNTYPPQLQRNWEMARILAGGVYTVPLTKRSGPELMFRVLGGIQKTWIPDYAFVSPYVDVAPGYTPWIKTTGSSMPWAFSYEGDAGIKWNFPGKIALLAYAGYNGARPSKNVEGPLTVPPNNVPGPANPAMIPPAKLTVTTGSLLVRAGISYTL